MSGLPRMARRAAAMPPRRAARAAWDLAAVRLAARRRWLGDLPGRDPLAGRRVARLLKLGHAALEDALALAVETPHAVLPLATGPQLRARAAMHAVDPAALNAITAAARQAMEHRFDLLGSGPVRVGFDLEAAGLEGHRYAMAPGARAAERQRRRMEQLLPGSGERYEPIDWHVDFISGYRWQPRRWYASVRIGHLPGVDVKVPWELSRLQHAGALGLAWRLAPDTPEGQRAPAEFMAQVVDWIAANPLRRGVNWRTSMDVALRAYSWLVGLALMGDAPAMTPAFRSLLLRSLAVHGAHIEENLEYVAGHAGNHYLANVLGLVALGAALPSTPRTDRWLAFGLQELVSEMERQVLPDGCDFEGSLSYHGFVAEMFLCGTAIALRLPAERRQRLTAVPGGRVASRRAPTLREPDQRPFDPDAEELFPARYLDRLHRMAELVVDFTGRDGHVPQIGDGDSGRVLRMLAPDDPRDWRQVPALAGRIFGDASLEAAGAPYRLQAELIVPEPVTAAAVAAVHGREVRHAVERFAAGAPEPNGGPPGRAALAVYRLAGLAVAREGPLLLTLQFAGVPRDAPGGHFHNDVLSFELSWDGTAFVVDGGAYLYTPEPSLRNAFRATAAHSTVMVQGREQRGWPPPDVSLFSVDRDVDVVALDHARPGHVAAHTEYLDVRHDRAWRWTAGALVVEDRVESPAPADWSANLAPGVRVVEAMEERRGHVVELEHDGRRCTVRLEGTEEPELAEGFYAIGYGRRVPSRRIVARLRDGSARTTFSFRLTEGS